MQRVTIVALACALACSSADAAAPSPATMTQIIANLEARHAIVAAEVYDLDTGKPLFQHDAQTLMEAASTTKLVTNGTTLALLGPNYRFTTPVYRTGTVDTQGVLHGDLVLVARGDANISQRIRSDGTLAFENEDHSYDGGYDTKAVPGDPLAVLRDLASQVAKAGIKQIDGKIDVDTSLFADQGPEAGTGAVVSPIVVNDNLVDVTVTAGAKVGDVATIAVSPQTPYVTFVDKATTAAAKSEPTIDMSDDKTEANGHHTVTIDGSVPAGRPILFAYRVPEPGAFAEQAFAVALAGAGVQIAQTPSAAPFDHATAAAWYVPANLVAQHVSPPIAQDVRITLKVSDNLHADLQPYIWGAASGASSHLERAGFKREHRLLQGAGLDLSGAVQQDGLGGFAFFTPNFMVHYLAWASRQSWFAALRNGLPILGVDGTLYNIQNDSPARGKVFAKTGTWGSEDRLNGGGLVTKGLAGFMTTRRGHRVAFAFYINRLHGKSSIDQSIDGAHQAGQLLGAMATDTYLSY